MFKFDTITDIHLYYDREFESLDNDRVDGHLTEDEYNQYKAALDAGYAKDLENFNGPNNEPF